MAADYDHLDILDGKIPHGLHNAELSLVAVPGIPQTNVQIVEKLDCPKEQAPKKGEPKTDRERLIAHFGEETALKLLELIGEEAYKLLPKRGSKAKEQAEPEQLAIFILRDPASFLPDHFSTSWIDYQTGIQAIHGSPREQTETQQVMARLFSKAKGWTLEKAQNWLNVHPEYLPVAVGAPARPTPPKPQIGGIETKNISKEFGPETT